MGAERKLESLDVLDEYYEYCDDFSDCIYDEYLNMRIRSYVELPTERRLQAPEIVEKRPPEGRYILYNLKNKHEDCSGHPFMEPRGIAYVLGYTKFLVRLLEIRSSMYSVETSFSIRSEIKTGLLKWRVLDDVVTKPGCRRFTYKELDIENPHPHIAAHIICDETEEE